MAFQKFTSSGYRDTLDLAVSFATSQHISAATINAAGTGYVAGDILTISHAGATLDATIEVLTVGGSGEVVTVRLRNRGAFSNRVATVAVNAGGAGYSVGEVATISGGTFTEQAKVEVTSVSGGVVDGVAVYEYGGAYSVAPGSTGAATVGVGPSTFGGDDALTVDITMTGLIGTSAIAATGGTGSGASFDLTLAPTGWETIHDRNDYAGGVRDGEREVVLSKDRSPNQDILLGFRTYVTGAPEQRWGIKPCGFAGYNPLIDYDSQALPIAGTDLSSTNPHMPFVEGSHDVWLRVDEFGFVWGTKVVDVLSTVYMSAFQGLLVPFGTTSENPYPMVITGFTYASTTRPNQNELMTGLATLICGAPNAGSNPIARLYRASNQTQAPIANWEDANNTPSRVAATAIKLTPLGSVRLRSDPDAGDYNETTDSTNFRAGLSNSSDTLGVSTIPLYPTPNTGGDLFCLLPLTVVDDADASYSSPTDRVVGEIAGACWVPGWKNDGTSIDPEDTIENADGVVVHALPSSQLTEPYAFTGIEES